MSRAGTSLTEAGTATLRDLARQAGVSRDTASVVLNGSRSNTRVSDATRRWQDGDCSTADFNDRWTDGIVAISPPTDSDMVPALSSLRLPLVVVDWPSCGFGVPYVYGDDVQGAGQATRHLLALGHTRIAHLIGTRNKASAPVRRDTFLAVMAEAGITVPPAYLVPGSYRAETTYADTMRLLALPDPPTALFAGNDVMAAEALRAARDRGLSVPEQLSIVGYDDSPVASLTMPPLTTVHLPRIQIGETAARLLIARVAGDPVPETTHLLKPELIVRGSTAPPFSR